MTTRRQILRGLLGLGAGAALWLPGAHLLFRRDLEGPLPPLAAGLLERHLALWEGSSRAEIAAMREANPEWDFMGRTFAALALASVALADPSRTGRHLAVLDRALTDTLEAEATHGPEYFLLPYATGRPWVDPGGHSVFVDGEIALVLAARLAVAPDPAWAGELRERLDRIARQMRAGPVLSAESYPDECWTFCNTTALLATALADPVLGTDHRALRRAWLRTARERLVHDETGLLISSYTHDGEPLDGPEGSSIWWSAHNLRAVDPAFARDQYRRAREHLGRRVLGFGWAREWPDAWRGRPDIDSGPVVPVLDASASSSGLALIAAGAFGDEAFLRALVASLDLAAFPGGRDGGIAYRASNPVGDAVILYALVQQALLVPGRIG